jgi:transcriptional regulator with XRE-family HTH domain
MLKMIDSAQLRAARALLRLDQEQVARRARVSVATVRRLESDEQFELVADELAERVRAVLEKAGAEFIDDGVRRKSKARAEEDQEAMFQDIMEIARRASERPVTNPDFGEKDLYDEHGLPA